ncbi:MAG: YraN family protein [Acidobacteria bacterium]|nr:YraN family protein [Acidobacteriota bacterium]
MPLLARLIFGLVNFAARNGLADSAPAESAASKKLRARRTGIRGETFAYWYLRRHGYIFVARNFTVPGIKGELDLVGYDGPVLAFVEVKTRAGESKDFGTPEDAVTPHKQEILTRMARQFLLERRLRDVEFRFDVLAIESRPGRRPLVRLHKNAF